MKKLFNKFMVFVIAKILNIEPYFVKFKYERKEYDVDNVTPYGYLLTVKREFNKQAKKFNNKIDNEIEKIRNS